MMKRTLKLLCAAVAAAVFSIGASAQGPMGGGMPPMGGGFPMGGFPGMMGGMGGSSKQDDSYSKKLAKILTADQFQKWEAAQAAKKAAKAAASGSFQMPEGFQLPEGFQMPEGGFQMPEGFTPGQMPQGLPQGAGTPQGRPEGAPQGMPQGAGAPQGMPQGMPEGFQMPEGGFPMPQMGAAEDEDPLESRIGSLSGAEIKQLAQNRTDRMANELGLDEAQIKKVLKLNMNDIRIRQNSGGSMGGFGGMMGGGMPPMGGGMPF